MPSSIRFYAWSLKIIPMADDHVFSFLDVFGFQFAKEILRYRREIRADAGDRQAEMHSRKRVGPQALPRRVAARREGGQDVGRYADGPT